MIFLTPNVQKSVKKHGHETIKTILQCIVSTLIFYLISQVAAFWFDGQFQMISLPTLFFFSFTGFIIVGSAVTALVNVYDLSNSIRYGMTRKEYMTAVFIDMLCFYVLALVVIPILANLAGFQFPLMSLVFSISVIMWFIFFSALVTGLLFVRFHWFVGVSILLFGIIISGIIIIISTWNGLLDVNLNAELNLDFPQIDDPYLTYVFGELSLPFQGILNHFSPFMLVAIPVFFGVAWLLYRDMPIKVQ